MKLLIEPVAADWKVSFPTDPAVVSARRDLAIIINKASHAHLLDPTLPIIATGHQAWFWHPGILAKDMAAVTLSPHFKAQPLHLVVDHDEHPAATLQIPYIENKTIQIHEFVFGPESPTTPGCCLPPWNSDDIVSRLFAVRKKLGAKIACDPNPLIEAWAYAGKNASTLAQQITQVTFQAAVYSATPWLPGPIAPFYSSDLDRLPAFNLFVEQMCADAQACIEAYNGAVVKYPDAGILPLKTSADRIEVPLWAVSRVVASTPAPRLRLFVETVQGKSQLISENGTPINRKTHRILPRALLLSAFMRRYLCDLFIHGKGGGEYDHITDHWFSHWQNPPMASRAVVSADLHLPFNVPIASKADLTRAIWYRHHLPHNPDKETSIASNPALAPLILEKQQALQHMTECRSRTAKAVQFQRIHQLNQQMVQLSPALLQLADDQVATVRAGCANHAGANRRDWFFGLYPLAQQDLFKHAFTID
jgi:hypothetical protein